MANRPGALVISLDFELHWGIRDHVTRDDACTPASRDARPPWRTCSRCSWHGDIRATWATVGFLFASTRDEVEACAPDERPTYSRSELDPYVGGDRDRRAARPRASGRFARRADRRELRPGGGLAHVLALLLSRARAGREQRSGPTWQRHGRSPTAAGSASPAWYCPATSGTRPTQRPSSTWGSAASAAHSDPGVTEPVRGGKQASCTVRPDWRDTYIGSAPPPTTGWEDVASLRALCNVPASAFLRPYDPSPQAARTSAAGPIALRDCGTRRSTDASSTCGGTRTISRSTKPRTSLCSSRSSTNSTGWPPSEGMQSLTMADVATGRHRPGRTGRIPIDARLVRRRVLGWASRSATER